MTTQEAIRAIRPEGGLSIQGNGKRVAEFFEGLAVATEALEKQAGIERALERLEEESRLAEEDKEYARAHNPLQYERCDSYLTAIDNAIEILKEEVANGSQ